MSVATHPTPARAVAPVPAGPSSAPSLRARLSRLVILALLPLVIVAGGLSYAGYRSDRDKAAARATDIARAAALAVERELRAMVAATETLALSPSLAGDDLVAFRREATTLVNRHFPGANMLLVAPNGQQLMNLSVPPGAALPVRRFMDTTRAVVATGRPAISDVYEGVPLRRPVVAVDVPVLGPGDTVRLVLSLGLPAGVFRDLLYQQQFRPNWVAGILDRKGTVVARVPDPDGSFSGRPGVASFVEAMLAREEGTTETMTLDGIPVLTGFSRPGPTGWVVAVGMPRAELHVPLWQNLAITAGASVFALLGALLLARFAAARIAGPVHRLLDLAAGRSTRVPGTSLGLREADDVAAALARAEAERRESDARLRLAQEAGGVGVWEWAPDTGEERFSEEMHRLYGLPPGAMRTYAQWLAKVHPEDRDGMAAERDAAITARVPFDIEFRIRRADTDEERWIEAKGRAEYDEAGRVTRVLGINMDVTERKRAEERRHLLVNELNHRVKNSLATVQSIALQTLRGADPEMRRTLDARLRALGAAHDVLTREDWTGAGIADVVAGALAPHGGADSGRFEVGGTPLRLSPYAALSLSLGLHELATNAAKYGALSAEGGYVALRWEIAAGETPRFRLTWTEAGGPPVAQPSRRGFGSRLIERGLAHDLGGKVVVTYAPDGLRVVVEAPLGRLTGQGIGPG